MLIGLISDTHGYFDDRIREAFAGVDHILHAGDIGSMDIIRELEKLAPVTAVRGNADRAPVFTLLATHHDLCFEGCNIHLVHRFDDSKAGPEVKVLVHGHSHEPLIRNNEKYLRLNPGSAGRTYLSEEPTVGLLHIDGDSVRGEIVGLGPR
ncbi:MAG: metallophosphoesterase family protein [Dehalococcoidia bacterium]|nr:metallophosphoesterase family protein [Dehalococcoidia bacterium]